MNINPIKQISLTHTYDSTMSYAMYGNGTESMANLLYVLTVVQYVMQAPANWLYCRELILFLHTQHREHLSIHFTLLNMISFIEQTFLIPDLAKHMSRCYSIGRALNQSGPLKGGRKKVPLSILSLMDVQ